MVENSNSPTPGFGTVPSWERKKKRKNTPLSAVIVISLVFGGTAGGALGYLAADFSNGVSNTTSQVSETSKPVAITPATETVSQIVQNVKPSVVSIKAEGSSGSGTGSGFIYREDGYIVTNNHVAAPAINGGKLTVYLEDKTSFEAKLVGRNASYDLAVLKIDATGLKPVNIGDSSAINVGDLTVAFGSPLGLTGTVTSGIVSAINRPVTAGGADDQSFISAIQTDAAINPGNSGGPLVNGQGQVIGVNSAIATLGNGTQSGSIGLGFAIPINQAQRVISEIIESGKSTTPIAGISIDSTYDGVGAKIAEVVADGPAASTDLKVGDIVTKINGEVVEDSTELIVAIRRNNPGDTIVLMVKNSAGNEREVSVVLGSREEG
ncbi:MAG: trypsin-like peptidase domain-containing protein [Actinobacteria bacterium]|nr:trypsin-like peptidase domain-containing protein [Actinomycetota bacterium]